MVNPGCTEVENSKEVNSGGRGGKILGKLGLSQSYSSAIARESSTVIVINVEHLLPGNGGLEPAKGGFID